MKQNLICDCCDFEDGPPSCEGSLCPNCSGGKLTMKGGLAKRIKIDKIVTFLIENDVKAEDLYFRWREIFDGMIVVEHSRKGLQINKYGYKYESGDV